MCGVDLSLSYAKQAKSHVEADEEIFFLLGVSCQNSFANAYSCVAVFLVSADLNSFNMK